MPIRSTSYPLDETEYSDLDFDGIGDREDIDIDGDGILNEEDVYPADTDNDGYTKRRGSG